MVGYDGFMKGYNINPSFFFVRKSLLHKELQRAYVFLCIVCIVFTYKKYNIKIYIYIRMYVKNYTYSPK